ncbi:acyl-coenzyme A thioesterase PaaI-like protein [Pullulanibacillus pueri]|uniref:Acyl-coenzyme A thioesterase THEM4 n=1 Tax=Pullulanibacillus pueri TaxID=1437324 RepID=A0A8J3ELD9_9BACL|nr:PaaI family thioesterase [Pullulanibacillus pueri]MBM7681373.1 acyl-coenzyme A thioesterase PaaI-like protein [Pullulanibacillus pueri]GGH78622.1 thioesterase [Pullulanibacillus pueri]
MNRDQAEARGVQAYYPKDMAWCYGCGRLNEAGHHFQTNWEGEETVTTYTPCSEHMAIPGFVYGGLIASLLDCHSTGSASLALYRDQGHELGSDAPLPRCVTASLKVDYLKPTPLGVKLIARGKIRDMNNKKVVVESELYAEGILCARGEVVAVSMPENFGK